ncbi:MAG: hypothetical protein ACRCZI_06200 [Cetobacterium sp.]
METAELRGAIVGKEQQKNWLEGQDVAPMAFETKARMSLEDLKKRFGEKTSPGQTLPSSIQ